MNVTTFGTVLMVGGLLLTGPGYAQTDSSPPNAVDSQSASDRPRAENARPDSTVSLSFGPSVLSSGAQVEIPLAERSDNAANNPPVDRSTATPK
jgi:hypothetical protein